MLYLLPTARARFRFKHIHKAFVSDDYYYYKISLSGEAYCVFKDITNRCSLREENKLTQYVYY